MNYKNIKEEYNFHQKLSFLASCKAKNVLIGAALRV